MGRITVVNLTNSTIQSAIANTGNIHSGINGVLPNVYYHHNASSGTGYDVWEKWYIPGIVEDFPSSDLEKIGWYIAGAFITALGIVGTILSAGTLAPAWAAYVAAESAVASAVASGSAAAISAAATLAVESFNVAMLAAGATAIGGFVGVTGLGITAGTPIADYVKALQKRSEGTVWGQDDKILQFTGQIPLEVTQKNDANGKQTTEVTIPAGMTVETAPPPTFAGYLTHEKFDEMRRKGEIYQIKHRDGEYCDVTQGLVRLSLRGAGGKEKRVTHAGITVDISKTYKMKLVNKDSKITSDCLMAGEDEGDDRVYLRKQEEGQELSCCYWQFIPTREGGVNGQGGWLIVDRRYGRFLYWSGSEILQYQSEQVGATKFSLNDGWAEHVELSGMIWNLVPASGTHQIPQVSIEQPGEKRICVTGRTDRGRAIYARSYGSPEAGDVFQTWAVLVQD